MNRVMEPRIQYAKTSDGVSIAYAVFGEGTPLVYTAGSGGVHFYTHLAISRRSVDQLMAAGLQVIRYDGRGTGSSDRNVRDFSLETGLLDLEAVVERLGLERFALVGRLAGAPAAIAYAARRPERVSHLVLRDPWASAADIQSFPDQRILKAMRPLAEEHWELISLNVGYLGLGFNDSELVKEYAAALRSGMTAAVWMAQDEAANEIDVTGLLEAVSAPTLVVLDTTFWDRSPDAEAVWGGAAKKIAASILDARVVTTDDFAAAVGEFVHAGYQSTVTAGRTAAPGALQTILFTDVEGSTVLTDRLGDAAARDVMREHERITREALRAHGGSEVKTMGDGFMASFSSATKALDCAVAIQKAFDVPGTTVGARRASPLRPEHGIRVRIGLNAGEPIAEDDPNGRSDLFGTAVIVAARIAAQAHGGEILVSDVVRQLVAGKGFVFNDRGGQALKGFEDPVHVWEVRWTD